MNPSLIAAILLTFLVVIILVKTAVVVPQKSEYIVERLGKYSRTLGAGFHILIPFLDKIAYKYMLKEEVINIASQTCITKDNVTVEVDGLIYLQVQDSKLAAYGISDYRAASQALAQTTLRSAVGKIDLDKTFEERDSINAAVVNSLDEAAQSWGVKLLRYEVSDIVPPPSVKEAMEAQMTAERAKRAEIAHSEGVRQSMINEAEGARQNSILVSEGEKQKMINEAQGRAAQILAVAEATATGLGLIATQLEAPGGMSAANLRVAEQYVGEFGKLAQESTTLIVPNNTTDIAGIVAQAMATLNTVKKGQSGDFKFSG
ncbi:MAG: stomatin-like protein [Desulfuromonas sp.]|nr:stomatin-like protein [Desulfuromonas sp.]